ncbi:CDP-diacylglycerol---serine O-phosphatidyltransferase [Rhodococcus rhodochrous J3]|uniref:Phosphatidylcholine/phosphatidylserine synthase n=2 Tax=Rhodococcus rhodochrous TaxID=1829 RepID=A0AA47A935_RHORH|nr:MULTISPECIES: phosphatidylcholine/phosphatidylserine synthase [Rhodococcus]AYA23697.1 phosphatidylcholine/phosphatidylserine synthase [Rhodococcus rhodochrous]MBF4480801.1 phosphatidylcholine/phosphatidylserine synthase [Rhodococcus rhodochrous]MCB8909875.1 phosphatidylcholine/phosphatidylserine synthase [Rhodococcus rhodochrous]MCD2097051.1 phosphatidylcholine/phosphatidylserine synthase [Rhodococcus rhodochrous]MCD2120517.1 phosphatidylcholine/phosphatidylserine synthase [Rhodococcus rhod
MSPHTQGARAVATGRSRNRPNVVRLLPSVITILAFSAGLSAVKFALDGQLGTALGMIGAAAVLDSLDGRIARMLDATSKIGAELDSLSDAVAFGVAPALVLYVTMLDGSPFGWIVALLYAVSLVLRLARFNTLLEDDSVPAYAREYFVGVPAPAAALVALSPVAAYIQWGDGWWTSYGLVALWILGTAGLAVSRIPTFAMKSASVPARLAVVLLVLVAVAAAALVTYPFILMLVLVAVYLAHIPFAVRSRRWVAARPETWDIKPSERRALRARNRAQRPRRVAARRVATSARSQARLGLRRPRGR